MEKLNPKSPAEFAAAKEEEELLAASMRALCTRRCRLVPAVTLIAYKREV